MNLLNDFFAWLEHFSSSPWFYLIIFTIAVADSVIPIVPSETLVIVGGVSAGSGELSIAIVVLVAAAGAFIGDNMSYFIGRQASERILKRYTRNEKSQQRLEKVIHQIKERGGLLLITARFIPGGRTLLTLTCGITRRDHRWFVGWIVAAASIWALYASLLGFIGGKTFQDDHTKAFLVAFGGALSATVLIEAVRFVRKRLRA
jgi:membrane protein DedA with SNARE-associated domain